MKDIDTLAIRLLKAQASQRFTYGVVYPVDKADVTTAQDGHRDFAKASVVERAAWRFLAAHRDVGLFHDNELGGNQATVVESHIHRGPPYTIEAADGSSVTVAPGDWLLGCVWSEEAWPLVQKGVIRGFSPQGTARRRRPSKSDLKKLRERSNHDGRRRGDF